MRKSPLATKNLLEVTDGLRRPLYKGGRRNPPVTSRCGSPLLLLTCALLMTSSHSEGTFGLLAVLGLVAVGAVVSVAFWPVRTSVCAWVRKAQPTARPEGRWEEGAPITCHLSSIFCLVPSAAAAVLRAEEGAVPCAAYIQRSAVSC